MIFRNRQAWPPKALKGTIFIITYGRSGSTLLQTILQSIPGAHITGENGGALHGLYQSASSLRQAIRNHGQKPHPQSHPWHGLHEVSAETYEQRLAQTFIEEILHPPANARWIGFKEIRYPSLGQRLPGFLNFCSRSFPNPVFVFNSRDAEAVRKSKWWADQPAQTVIDMVQESDRLFESYTRRHPDRAHHVRYETLLADPASLKPLFDMLDEPFDAAQVTAALARKLTH